MFSSQRSSMPFTGDSPITGTDFRAKIDGARQLLRRLTNSFQEEGACGGDISIIPIDSPKYLRNLNEARRQIYEYSGNRRTASNAAIPAQNVVKALSSYGSNPSGNVGGGNMPKKSNGRNKNLPVIYQDRKCPWTKNARDNQILTESYRIDMVRRQLDEGIRSQLYYMDPKDRAAVNTGAIPKRGRPATAAAIAAARPQTQASKNIPMTLSQAKLVREELIRMGYDEVDCLSASFKQFVRNVPIDKLVIPARKYYKRDAGAPPKPRALERVKQTDVFVEDRMPRRMTYLMSDTYKGFMQLQKAAAPTASTAANGIRTDEK